MKSSHNSISLLDLIRLSLRIFKTKPTRTFLTILGMSIGISAVVFLVSLGYGLQYILLGRMVTSQDSLTTLSASYPSESALSISTSSVAAIASLEHAAETTAIAEFNGVLTMGTSTGLIPSVRIAEPSAFRLSGIMPDIGSAFVEGESGIVVSEQALQLMSMTAAEHSLGEEVRVELYLPKPDGTVQNVPIPQIFTVSGIISDTQEPPIVFIPAHTVPFPVASYKEILVRAKNADALVALRDILTQQGFVISANIDLVAQAEKITNVITIILAVFGITALVVSAIGMFNTMLISFIERTYEVGVMKAIGATDANVRDLFLMESAVMGFLGGTGGITIGLVAGKLANLILNFISLQMGGKSFQLFILPLWFGAFIFVISIVIGIFAGLVPAHRAAKLSPREAFTKK